MPNKNNMEEFFKQKNKEHKYAYNPEAWQDLSERLNKDERKRRGIWWWFGIGMGSLLILVLSYEYTKTINSSDINKIVTQNSRASQNVMSIEYDENKELETVHNTEEGPIFASTINKSNSTFTPDNNEKQTAIYDLQVHDISSYSIESNPSDHMVSKDLVHKGNKSNRPTISPLTVTDNSIGPVEEKSVIIQSVINKKLISTYIPYLSVISIHPLQEQNTRTFNIPLIDSTENITRANRKKLMISALWAIEASGTKAISTNNYDTKIGFSINYFLSNKLSIFTGLSLINDFYFTTAEQYNVAEGYWTKSIAPSQIMAQCKMLEIPIGISYQFNGIEKSGWSVRVQSNTILMLNENYKYTYDVADPELRYGWTGTNSSQDYFSTLSLGIGYQQWLNPSIGVSLTPYVSTAISGIGHGNIFLNNAGLELSINFK